MVNVMTNFIVQFPLKTEKYQEDILDKRFEMGIQIYNSLVNITQKRYKEMIKTKNYRNLISQLSGDKTKDKDIWKQINDIRKQFGMSEYSFYKDVKRIQHHFSKNIDALTARSIASNLWKAYEKLFYGNGEHVHYKRYDSLNSLEGITNTQGIRFRDDMLLWNGLRIPVVIDYNNYYENLALKSEIAVYTFKKDGTMGGYEDGAKVTYQFYDEATGQPMNLVRMFGIGDIEAGENLGITSNDKVSSIVPMTPSDKAKGWQEGTHGYARVQQMGEKTAWTFGDEHYANANHGQIPGDPTTVGNNNSTPLAQTIGIFSGNTLSASWSGAGGGLDLNSRNILFKEKPEKITDENYPNPKEPDYEKIPDEPEYTPVPDALPEPTAPVAPTLNTITEPVAPVVPGEAPTEPVKPEDVDVSRTIHYHRAYRLKPVTTKWVDEDGNELKTPVTDDTTKEHGDITGYSFVRSDEDELENVTHVFKQHTTSWIDIDTNESLKDTVKGIKEHGDIEKYYFVESETKPTGDVVHKFRAVTTSYVTEKSEEVFPTEKGTHKEKAHKDYSYKRTEVDKNGNTKHIYVKFNTEHMDEDKNRIANREEGAKDPKEIPGYEYIRSIPDIENTLITHIYRQVTTSWVEEGGKTLKPTDKGVQEHGEFSGYTYIRTETKSNGDVVHTFKKVSKEPTNDFGIVGFAVTSVLSLVGIVALKKKKD